MKAKIDGIRTQCQVYIESYLSKKMILERKLQNLILKKNAEIDRSIGKRIDEKDNKIKYMETELENLRNSLEVSKKVIEDHAARLSSARLKFNETDTKNKELLGQLGSHKNCENIISCLKRDLNRSNSRIKESEDKFSQLEADFTDIEEELK
ncbi:MAG: hypothetical protein MHPSP_000751 [Paramarteilia canceri]